MRLSLDTDIIFLSTPSARRATGSFLVIVYAQRISIHALREEGDRPASITTAGANNFYPRPPRGGRPGHVKLVDHDSDFYPRPPRGGRRHRPCPDCGAFRISIHALREEGDAGPTVVPPTTMISIHALREEGDQLSHHSPSMTANFYPRPPRGGRRCYATHVCVQFIISIHALREEGDFAFLALADFVLNFYPRPPRGGRRVSPDVAG